MLLRRPSYYVFRSCSTILRSLHFYCWAWHSVLHTWLHSYSLSSHWMILKLIISSINMLDSLSGPVLDLRVCIKNVTGARMCPWGTPLVTLHLDCFLFNLVSLPFITPIISHHQALIPILSLFLTITTGYCYYPHPHHSPSIPIIPSPRITFHHFLLLMIKSSPPCTPSLPITTNLT